MSIILTKQLPGRATLFTRISNWFFRV